MTGGLRYLLVAGFLALFFLVPAPNRPYLAFLQTRSWLMSDASPLGMLREGNTLAVVNGALTPARDANGKPVVLQTGTPLYQMRSGLLHRVPGLPAAAKTDAVAGMPPLVLNLKPQGLEADYDRVYGQWIRKQREAGANIAIQRNLPATGLEVYAGHKGTQITLAVTTGDGQKLALAKRTIPIREGELADLSYHPDRKSLIPAFLAIALAILTGKVILSLLVGCLAGSLVFVGGNPLTALWHFFSVTVHGVLTDDFQLQIMAFVIFLFMAVGVMTRSGGVQGMVNRIRRYAKGPVSTQVCSFLVGLLVFFDDYTNCILTGTTMRPLADHNRVSREKLAYIVDSTAAPIAGICIFSTWVAYEISMFAPQLPEVVNAAGVPYDQKDGFAVFQATLPFRFYCLFTLAMVLLTILTRREFGSMLTAERRARNEGKPVADDANPMVSEGFQKLDPPADIPHRAINALLPIGLLVTVTIGLMTWFGIKETADADLQQGLGHAIREILGNTDSTKALMYAALTALVVASLLALGQRLMSVQQVAKSAIRSASALGFAVIILILAWSIGRTCGALGTDQFLTAAFRTSLSPWLLPALMFLLSSLVAFSTGTSYGTMAILLPNIVVLSHTMGTQYEGFGGPALMVLTIGAVLEGSIFGDHCSPISDTTVLSSMATSSDHMHHVRTQAPYAVFVMSVSMVCGYLPIAAYGLEHWWLSWVGGLTALLLGLFVIGRRVK